METSEKITSIDSENITPEQARMVKISVAILVLSSLNNLLQNITGQSGQSGQSGSHHTSLIVWILTFAFSGFELWTAWGLLNMEENARKAFISILVITSLLLFFDKTAPSTLGGTSFIFLLVGLGIRGYFIYWYLDNEQVFSK